ncbi:MAG: sigma-70 family RNA polymerase sigma factor [Actinobacteria bacterium]|nr:sigma-70 family RNA polymerase sigma factor [Actinomycetota bacterium]
MTGELVDAAQAGAAAFDGYVRLHGDRLLRTACLVTRNWDEARDAVQDALVSLYPRWSTLSPERLDAYVHRAVTNACLMRLRRRRRVWPVAGLGAETPGSTADPAVQVVEADEVGRLCASLPPVQRAAVVLRFYSDLSYAEVARALGCSEATARSHVHRAIVRLRGEPDEGGRS